MCKIIAPKKIHKTEPVRRGSTFLR